jgi:hypothetical protein
MKARQLWALTMTLPASQVVAASALLVAFGCLAVAPLSASAASFEWGGLPPFEIEADLTLADSDLDMTLRVDPSGERLRIEARLISTQWHLGLLGFTGLNEKAPTPEPAAKATPGRRVFPDWPLPLDRLSLLDADLRLQIGALVGPDAPLAEGVDLAGRVAAGRLELEYDVKKIGDGSIRGALQAEQSGAVSWHGEARGVALGPVLESLGGEGVVQGGRLDVDVDLRGKGENLRALLAGAQGSLLIVGGEGRLNQELLGVIGADLLASILRTVNPFAEQNPESELKCFVFKASVEDGMMRFKKGIAAESTRLNMLGGGTIDLGTEGLDLGIQSEPREGLGISLHGVTGRLVRISGTLAEPKLALDLLGAAETAARIGGAIVTGGLSLLGEIAVGALGKGGGPCEKALG